MKRGGRFGSSRVYLAFPSPSSRSTSIPSGTLRLRSPSTRSSRRTTRISTKPLMLKLSTLMKLTTAYGLLTQISYNCRAGFEPNEELYTSLEVSRRALQSRRRSLLSYYRGKGLR